VQAWLVVDQRQSALAVEQFIALVPVLRRAVISADASDALIADVDRERDNWVATFDSADQADVLTSANAEFAALAESSQSEDVVAEQVLSDALAPIRGIYATLRGAINSSMDQIHRRVFEFGEMLDGALRPPTIYREMPRGSNSRPPDPGGIDATTSEGTGSTPLAWLRPQRGTEYRWYLPTGCVDHTSQRPGERWFQDLAEFWRLLELPGEPPAAPGPRLRGTLEQLIAGIDRRVRLALSRVGVAPRWDAGTSELRIGSTVVRNIAGRAVNLLLVVRSFEELRWPRRIDSPLPPGLERFSDTIRTLNEGLSLIRFRADGTGTGIVWEWRESG
jgi:hypothetical protein